MSDTPRVDKEAEEVMFTPQPGKPGMGFGEAVNANFARQIERELNECKLLAIQLGLAFAGRCDSAEELQLVEKSRALMGDSEKVTR